MKEIRKFALAGAALFLASLIVGSTSALAQFQGPVPLTLINGWTNAPFATSIATVEEIGGIVQFRGAIATAGTNANPFVLPASFTPAYSVYVPIDLCAATKGRLWIQSNGTVTVEAEKAFSNAQCFTSLDGASFALNASGSTPLTLINGWTNAPFGTSNAAVRQVQAIVHLQGAIATSGTNAEPFVLPAAFAPAANVYIPIDLCNATNGRLLIEPSGVVIVQAETAFSNAQCFTSLDGAWFVSKLNGAFRGITLINGWTPYPGSHVPEVGNNYGVVYFQGAIHGGSSAAAFALGAFQTPVTNVYVNVDLCDATKGRLFIQNNGSVTIQTESGDPFTDATCFTSLDGVSFVQ